MALPWLSCSRANLRALTATLFIAILLSCLTASDAFARDICARIGDGTIINSHGEVIQRGFDDWGYDYQAHLFWGGYCDAKRDAPFCQPFADVDLMMKWNDAWLSNRDCDGDHYLDRHSGYSSYRGSGAWLLNAMHGSYDQNGTACHWFYVVKIQAAPLDAQLVDGVWYSADGKTLGPEIWSDFAITQAKLVDPCGTAAAAGLIPAE
jgi:hypothetical protein